MTKSHEDVQGCKMYRHKIIPIYVRSLGSYVLATDLKYFWLGFYRGCVWGGGGRFLLQPGTSQ